MDLETNSLLSIAEVCKCARISKSHYFRLRDEGRGPPEIRLGKRKVFVSKVALAEWLGKATRP
jgi:predicted DNA-binding transcriptional regulator AlpA